MIAVLLLVMVVDVLLLSATARLLGTQIRPLRLLGAVIMDAVFAGLSLVPSLSFFRHFLWRVVILVLTGLMAFGLSGGVLVFTLLNLSLGSITDNQNELLPVLLGAAGIGFACIILGKDRRFIPVELTFGKQTLHLTALRDTGNTLRDPITGKSVLVVDAVIAHKLTGLSLTALQDPVAAMGMIPGLRLIPYQTVGNRGFLLALHIPDAKIGNRQGSAIVAFSPQVLGSKYQALTGGMV